MTPEQLIRSLAPRYQIDPLAALAVAMGEGGLMNREDDRGDGGRSFGPFQLFEKGALPQNLVGQGDKADAWAWSPAGIEYALGRMREAGAGGLSGAEAVSAIVRKFERPADPDSSVRNAIGRLGGITPQDQPAADAGRGTPVATTAAPQVSDPRTRLASMLLSRSMQRRGSTISPLLQQLLTTQRSASTAASATPPPAGAATLPSAPAGAGAYPYNPLHTEYKPLGAPGQGTHAHGEGPDNWQSDSAWDYGSDPGSPVYATDNGIVDPQRYGALNESGRFGGYRLTVNQGYDTPDPADDNGQFYQHLAENLAVKPGQRVRAGDLLGYIGSVPGLTPHLHYGRMR